MFQGSHRSQNAQQGHLLHFLLPQYNQTHNPIQSPKRKKEAHITLPQHGPVVQSSPQTATDAGISMTNDENNFLTVMQRQNDIAVVLAT